MAADDGETRPSVERRRSRPRSLWGSLPVLLLLGAVVIAAATVGLTDGSGAPEPDRRLVPPATGSDRRPSVLWSVPVDCTARTAEVDAVEGDLGCGVVLDDQRAYITEGRPEEAGPAGAPWGIVARDLTTGAPLWFRAGEPPPWPQARVGDHLVVEVAGARTRWDVESGEDAGVDDVAPPVSDEGDGAQGPDGIDDAAGSGLGPDGSPHVVAGDVVVTWDDDEVRGLGRDDLVPLWALPVEGATSVVASPDGAVLAVVTPSSIVAYG